MPSAARQSPADQIPADAAADSVLPVLTSPDGRQSPVAIEISRGVSRCLLAHGFSPMQELTLASGRRADVIAVSAAGDIWIVEIKSSVEDFRSDLKWPEYRDYCDRFFFAVQPVFPRELIPDEAGLIVADRFGGEVLRPAPLHKLAPSRRRALQLRFGRAAALRLQAVLDPDIRRYLGAAQDGA